MAKPRQKRTYTPELLENLRFRFEETGEIVREIAASVPMARSALNVLAREQGWTRYKRPPLDLTPAARLAAEAGKLAAEAGRLNLSGHPEARAEGAPRRISDSQVLQGPRPCEPETCVSPAMARPPQDDGESSSAPGPQEADLSNLALDARRARLSEMARAIDFQIAKVRLRQALPQRDHERKEIDSELNNLVVSLSQVEHQLQELHRGQLIPPAIDDDRRPMDIDERRLRLARRIREFVRSRRGGDDAAAVAGDGC
jgi:hypothetical protein